MVRVAFGSHGREKAVQLAIRVIFDIVLPILPRAASQITEKPT